MFLLTWTHHDGFSLHVLEITGASFSIFNHSESCNLAGPMGRWSIQHNKRESFFSGEGNLFCTVWDILMAERLVWARAPFSNSVELKSEMLPVRFCSIMSWFSGKKKKKSWKFGKDNLYLYLHIKEARLTVVAFTLYSLLLTLCNLSACCLCTILKSCLTFKIFLF